MSEWQPIETAPRDHDLILVASKHACAWSGVYVAYWSDADGAFLYSVGRKVIDPMHWKPLGNLPGDAE